MTQEPVGSPRDHLANERTHLAWLRTGANVMVVGLAVARFADGGELTATGVAAGSVLLVTGAAGVAYGTHRYRRLAAALRRGDTETAAEAGGPTVAAVVLLVAMVVSAAILLAGAA